MNAWERELFRACQLIRESLAVLKESGLTYIPKSFLEEKMTILNEAKDNANKLEKLRAELDGCQRCKLCSSRTNIVFGTGNPNATLVFVGEGPGAEEDKQGEPFVGRAGKLLTKMINAIGFAREEVYICNVVKCRPPKNRDPERDEIEQCEPFLKKQLDIIRPKVIVGLGRHACQTLLKEDVAMSKIRGRFHEYEGLKFMPTYHPAYLLRNPSAKKDVWLDLQLVMKEL